MRRSFWVLVVLASSVLVPLARATPAHGSLTATALDSSQPMAWEGRLLGAYDHGVSDGWVLQAPHVRVDVFTRQDVRVSKIDYVVNTTDDVSEVDDARISLNGDGWWAIDSPAAFRGVTLGVASANEATLGDFQPYAAHENDWDARFGVTFTGPLEVGFANGGFQGFVHAKVLGPTVRIASRQGDSTLATGQPPGAVTRTTWVVLTADDATVEMGPSGARVATSRATVSWDGDAWLRGASGNLVTARNDTLLSGDVSLTCACTLTMATGSRALDLRGDLRASSVLAPLPVDAPDPAAPITMTLILVAGLAAGAWLYRLWQRREHPIDAEECSRLADAAMEAGRTEDAIRWVRRARLLAPASARLAMDEAHAHATAGDHPSALRALEEAALLAQDGEPDFQAALLLLETGRNEEAARHMRRALVRSPDLAHELRTDPALRLLAELLRE